MWRWQRHCGLSILRCQCVQERKLLAIRHEENRRAPMDFGSVAGGHGTIIDAERSFCLTETIGMQEILISAALE